MQSVKDLSTYELTKLAERLAEVVADSKSLGWYWHGNIQSISRDRVNLELATDANVMFGLIRNVFEHTDATPQDWLIKQWNVQCENMIYQALLQYEEMPRGYDLGDYL